MKLKKYSIVFMMLGLLMSSITPILLTNEENSPLLIPTVILGIVLILFGIFLEALKNKVEK